MVAKGVLTVHAFFGFWLAIYGYAVVAMPAHFDHPLHHLGLFLLLALLWTAAWALARGVLDVPPRSEQPEPGWGGWFLVGVVAVWHAFGFATFAVQSLGAVGCAGGLGFPFIGTVALTGAAWLGAGIRFNVGAWIVACLIGIPCSLGFLYVFGNAMNGF